MVANAGAVAGRKSCNAWSVQFIRSRGHQDGQVSERFALFEDHGAIASGGPGPQGARVRAVRVGRTIDSRARGWLSAGPRGMRGAQTTAMDKYTGASSKLSAHGRQPARAAPAWVQCARGCHGGSDNVRGGCRSTWTSSYTERGDRAISRSLGKLRALHDPRAALRGIYQDATLPTASQARAAVGSSHVVGSAEGRSWCAELQQRERQLGGVVPRAAAAAAASREHHAD
jgi:hypothetical protein